LITFSKKLSKRLGFDAHHRQIDAKKERPEKDSERPPTRTYSESEAQEKVAEIERISGMSIRAGSREL
jgi:hypothetical protein